MPARTSPPPSAASTLASLLGGGAFFAIVALCRAHGMRGMDTALLSLGAYALIVLAYDIAVLRTPWRASAGLDFSRRDFSWPRYATRMLGMYGSFGFVALLYWLFPEYHGKYYDPYWDAAVMILPWLALLALPYGAFMDSRLKDPYDGYYWYGCALLLRWDGMPWRMLAQHLLGWLVKGFFLPFMFVGLIGNVIVLLTMDMHDVSGDFHVFHKCALALIYALDLLAAVTGYIVTLRLADTHIRSSEPTFFGWWICLICYQPFLSVYMRMYFAYNGSESNWEPWLADYPWLRDAWGGIGLILMAMYTYASLNFGCRFSNLTHRGIITGGMYRFSKHPAYLCKNIFWWMAYVPFASNTGWDESLRYCLLLAGINAVYFLRARTEERHLSRDPVYVAYALWINEHGLLARLGEVIPLLRYRAPTGWEDFPAYEGIG